MQALHAQLCETRSQVRTLAKLCCMHCFIDRPPLISGNTRFLSGTCRVGGWAVASQERQRESLCPWPACYHLHQLLGVWSGTWGPPALFFFSISRSERDRLRIICIKISWPSQLLSPSKPLTWDAHGVNKDTLSPWVLNIFNISKVNIYCRFPYLIVY